MGIKVLFVDDDSDVLQGLRRMLHSKATGWQMRFALGGEAALAEMDSTEFDAIVTDMRMPGMDGARLLAEVQIRQPSAARIVLSGHAEFSASMRSVQVAHQFLTKPCDAASVIAAVDNACSLQAVLTGEGVREAVTSIGTLPSAPGIVAKLNEVLGGSDPTVNAVAQVVQSDPALTAKLLQLVNSAFFAPAHEITEIVPAVSYLGVNVIRDLAVVVEAASLVCQSPEMKEGLASYQDHSNQVAELAYQIAGGGHTVFVAALLHDIGRLLLAARLPDILAQVDDVVLSRGVTSSQAEKDVLGATHAEIGAYLLNLWGLPSSITEVVARHHTASERPGPLDPVHATYIAECLVGEADRRNPWACGTCFPPPDYLADLGVSALVEQIRTELGTA